MIDDAISDPDASGIVISGSAGVGKSRIAREALDRAASNGCAVHWIVGTTSARTIPLGALAKWVGPGGADRLGLIRTVIDSLTARTPGTQVVIGVDDVPLLDDLSTFVVHQIVERHQAKAVLTVRDDEPVRVATREVWKVGRFDRLDLQPLSRHDTAALVATTLGGPLDPDAELKLWELTRGNVLYLCNIVEQEVNDGRIVEHRGFWRWIGDPVMPPGLVELIESRIGSLPPSVSDVIDTLAVGEPIDLRSLTRITDPAAVEEADERGLITLDRVHDRVEARVAHPLYGEVRRNRAPPVRLRRLRGLVDAELAGSEDRDDLRVVVRRAALSLDSDLEPDVGLLVRAAQGAAWMWDLPLADRLASAAVRAGDVVEANFVRAYVLSCLGRGVEADSVLAGIPVGDLDDTQAARLAFRRATNRLFTLADPTAAKKLIDDAWASTPRHARSCLDAFLAVYWAAMGRPNAVRAFSETFVWDRLPDVLATRLSAWATTVAAGDAGRTAEAAAAAESGYLVPVRSFVIIADGHVSALLLAGQIAEAQEPAQLLRRLAADFPASQFVVLGTALAGRAALGAGRLDTACGLLEPIVESLGASGETNGWSYRCQIPYAAALAMRGETERAAAALTALDEQRHPSWRYLHYEHAIASAWVAACTGLVTDAIATVLAAAETACKNGQFAAEVMCLQTATQFGDRTCATRLRALEATVEGPRVQIAARFAEALRAGDAAELESVSDDLERMGDVVAAVDAVCHAALVYRRSDLRGSSLGCAARGEDLARRCGRAITPALRQASERLPLTDREREVVMLIGEGLSNREIAARLTLSSRTVETHVYRAMTKTGTTTRDQLATLLSPRRAPTRE